jgi:hypothetical protein
MRLAPFAELRAISFILRAPIRHAAIFNFSRRKPAPFALQRSIHFGLIRQAQRLWCGQERKVACAEPFRDERRGGQMSQQNTSSQLSHKPKWSWWYLLFVIQLLAVVWPPFYNKIEPTFAGIPFFYWYQLLWVIIGAVLTAIVYFVTDREA